MGKSLKTRTFELCGSRDKCVLLIEEVKRRGATVNTVEPDYCETCEGDTDPAWYGIGTPEQIAEGRAWLRASSNY